MEEGEKEYEQAWIGLSDKEKGGVSFQVRALVLLKEGLLKEDKEVFK